MVSRAAAAALLALACAAAVTATGGAATRDSSDDAGGACPYHGLTFGAPTAGEARRQRRHAFAYVLYLLDAFGGALDAWRSA